MNQKSRQKANSPVEKDFFKPLNNSNFRIDCRNNIDNFTTEPLYDDTGEIAYIKKFISIYDNDDFKDFFSPQHMKGEVIQLFQNKIMHLDKNDSTYEARKQYHNDKMEEELDAVESFENAKNKNKQKLHQINGKIENCLDPRKAKMLLEFPDREVVSIKLFAIKKSHNIKVTTLLMSGKLLFAKLSLKSFIHKLIETCCFPSEKTKQIFDKYMIEKVELFHILTDADSTLLKFIFIPDPAITIPESKYRDILFEDITSTDIYKRSDSSHPF